MSKAIETIVSQAIERVIDHPDLTAGTKSLLHEIVTALELAEILPEGKVLVDVEDVKLLLSFCPKDCPEGLDPTFYHSLSYERDKEMQNRIDGIKAMIEAGKE